MSRCYLSHSSASLVPVPTLTRLQPFFKKAVLVLGVFFLLALLLSPLLNQLTKKGGGSSPPPTTYEEGKPYPVKFAQNDPLVELGEAWGITAKVQEVSPSEGGSPILIYLESRDLPGPFEITQETIVQNNLPQGNRDPSLIVENDKIILEYLEVEGKLKVLRATLGLE